MRISDWSSDVCSSDLHDMSPCRNEDDYNPYKYQKYYADKDEYEPLFCSKISGCNEFEETSKGYLKLECIDCDDIPQVAPVSVFRSEEHTSELQSLMRISYAVFCLKKKRNQQIHNINTADIMWIMKVLSSYEIIIHMHHV